MTVATGIEHLAGRVAHINVCWIVPQVLTFCELTLTIPEVIAVLLGFYLFFHIASFLALSQLYKQRR